MRIVKYHHNDLDDFLRESLRAYLARFSLDHALIPEGEDSKIREVFTTLVSPLRADHLTGPVDAPDDARVKLYRLVDPERTLRHYADAGIDVRLTRANFRTGRLEASTYVPVKEFACFLDKHAWRIRTIGPEKIPLGRVILEHVKVIDANGPLVHGSGEVSLTANVTSTNAGGIGVSTRLPETGTYPVVDRPQGHVININCEIFRGNVGDNLTIEVRSAESEEKGHICYYRREFSGKVKDWLRAYRPSDESRDHENVGDWQVWYPIEEV